MADFQKSKSIGGAWKRATAENKKFISARVELGGTKYDILLFPNTIKKSEKSPDFNIILSTPRIKPTDESGPKASILPTNDDDSLL